jgi:hypothetical protein
MARSTTRKRRATLAGIALSLVLMAAGSLPALAGGYVAKTFTMNVSPTPVIAGTSRAFSVAIKNTSNISLGSINLTVPPLLTITGASASKGTVTQAGNLVQVRTVGLGAGKSMTITVNAVAPCKTTTLTWYVMAMSGSNYTGTTFALDTTKSTKTTKVNGTCTLAFVAGRQPGSAHPNEVISSVDFDPSGAPIQVKVLDGSGNPSSFPANIALAIGSNPGGGTLGGTPTKTASGGIASFDDLTIDNAGVDYTLVASSTGFASVTSGPFTIADMDVPCEPNVDCIGDIDDGTTFANVNAKADPSATNLRISLLEGGPDCDDYTETTSTVEFSVSSGSRVKVVSIRFEAVLAASIEGFDPVSAFQVCYEAPTPFIDRNDESVTTGLLPDCDSYDPESTAPCVLSRVQGGDEYSLTSSYGTWVTVTFLAPAGDPKGRV